MNAGLRIITNEKWEMCSILCFIGPGQLSALGYLNIYYRVVGLEFLILEARSLGLWCFFVCLFLGHKGQCQDKKARCLK